MRLSNSGLSSSSTFPANVDESATGVEVASSASSDISADRSPAGSCFMAAVRSCWRNHSGHGLCQMHYMRAYRRREKGSDSEKTTEFGVTLWAVDCVRGCIYCSC